MAKIGGKHARTSIMMNLSVKSLTVLLAATLTITVLALSPVAYADSFGDTANVNAFLDSPFSQVATCSMTTHDGSPATTGCSGMDGSSSGTAFRNGFALGALATAIGETTSGAATTQANSGFSDTLTIGGTGQATLILTYGLDGKIASSICANMS
jgi:hypothetical protein